MISVLLKKRYKTFLIDSNNFVIQCVFETIKICKIMNCAILLSVFVNQQIAVYLLKKSWAQTENQNCKKDTEGINQS